VSILLLEYLEWDKTIFGAKCDFHRFRVKCRFLSIFHTVYRLFCISAFCHIGFLFYRLIDIGFLTVGLFRSAFHLESYLLAIALIYVEACVMHISARRIFPDSAEEAAIRGSSLVLKMISREKDIWLEI
jgi:hypothetical protein